MIQFIRHLFHDDSGATVVEYGLIVALISVVCVVVLGPLAGKLIATFTTITNAL